MSEHAAVPSVDVFSYTHAGAPWFDQEWLTQVLFYQVLRTAGGSGLALFKIALVLVLVLAMAWIGWRRSRSAVLATLTAIAAVLVMRPYLDIRPHLFTLLGTLVLLALTDAYHRRPRMDLLLALPLLLALWANLHYGFIYGVGALTLIAGIETLRALVDPRCAALRAQALALDVAAVAAAVACLLNPQHVHAFTFPFTILREAGAWKQVLEWLPVTLFAEGPLNPILFSYFLVAQFVGLAVALGCAWRRVDPASLALVVVTGLMAFQARRFVPLFALISAPFLAANAALVRERLTGPVADELRSLRTAHATVAVAVLALVWVGRECVWSALPNLDDGLFDGMIAADYFPRAGVEFLRRNALPARLYNFYNWGGYLMYWLPDRKVFIDGRAHEVYPSSFYDEYTTVQFAEPEWETVLDRYEVSLILWPSHERAQDTELADLLAKLDASPHWRLIYEDDHAAVFAHVERGRPWIESLEAATLVYPGADTSRHL